MDYFIHKTFAIHYKSAVFFLDNAEQIEDGRFYNIMSSILFSALCVEAYLNHQGSVEFDKDWESWDSQNKPNIKMKFLKLSKLYSLELDFSKEPFSIIQPLFEFRTLLVHGRTQTIQKKVLRPQNNDRAAILNLSSDIEKFCKIKNAQNIIKCVKKIIETLNHNSISPAYNSCLFNIGNGGFHTKKCV